MENVTSANFFAVVCLRTVVPYLARLMLTFSGHKSPKFEVRLGRDTISVRWVTKGAGAQTDDQITNSIQSAVPGHFEPVLTLRQRIDWDSVRDRHHPELQEQPVTAGMGWNGKLLPRLIASLIDAFALTSSLSSSFLQVYT